MTSEEISEEVDRLLTRARESDDERKRLMETPLREQRLLREEVLAERRHVIAVYQKKIDKLKAELDTYKRLLIVQVGGRKIETVGQEAKTLAACKRLLLNATKKKRRNK